MNYFVHKVDIPGVSLPSADEASPFITIPQPGDHVVYDPLVLTFLVDEGLQNYIQLQCWLKIIGNAESQEAYTKLAKNANWTGQGVKSEILLSLEDSAKNPIVNVNFHDAWPTNLSKLSFDATLADIPYLVATATFRYSEYEFVTSP